MTLSTDDRIATLERRVQRQEDLEAVKRLQRAYGYYLDKAMWRAVADLFAPEGTMEIAARGVYAGRERIHEFLLRLMGKGREGLSHGQVLNHFQLQGIVTLAEDGETANGRWRAFIQVGEFDTTALWLEGPYEVRYRKVDGVWMIASLVWFPTYTTPFAEGWAKTFLAPSAQSTELPPDQPQTHDGVSLPETWVLPFHYPHPVTGEHY